MNVDLTKLQPNPTRDFTVDPVDPQRVEVLRQSIRDYGFWSGIICRKTKDGIIQIGAGHTRVQAAILEGHTRADVCVSKDMDDDAILRVYGAENATQRNNQGSARVGTVAAAIKRIALCEFDSNVENSAFDHRGRPGIGARQILEYLGHIEGVNIGTVQQDLASLKQSGDYTRIITEVANERARRAEAARLAAEQDAENKKKKEEADREAEAAKKAEKAQEKAKADPDNDRKFDRAGVQKYFENPAQLDVFRKCVTGKGVAPYLPVDKQVDLAKAIVTQAKKDEVELSGTYIRQTIMDRVLDFKRYQQEENKKEKERLLRESQIAKAQEALRSFAGACRRMVAEGDKIAKLYRTWPDDLVFPTTTEFEKALLTAKEVVNRISDVLNKRN